MHSLIGHFPELVLVAGFGMLSFVLLHEQPRALAALWLGIICLVPWWIGLDYHTFYPAASLISIFALVCLLPILPGHLTMADWTVACLFGACLLPMMVGGSTKAATFGIAAVWLPGYLVGRLLPGRVDTRWLYGCVAVLFSLVSALAVAEFLFSWNPFIHFRIGAGSTYSTWGTLQMRGGRLRAEGAFGHAIALGSSVALAIPMTLASRFRLKFRIVGIGLMLAASVVTFSRTGMLCAVLGFGLSIVFLREGLTTRVRATATALVVILSVSLVPLVTGTFAAAGSEASNSADYRAHLTSLISDMGVVGLSDSAQRLSDGTLWFGQFRSIDSQLILLGLTYGSLALLAAVIALVASVVVVFLGRATAPTIAVVAQIPSLATVALITQYSVFFWFVAGVAVASQAERLRAGSQHMRSRLPNVRNTETAVGTLTAAGLSSGRGRPAVGSMTTTRAR